ncbi:Tll0287-like domain-containing protein [Acuticoccus kandeliae]|uniref:Tll0287-like domain-containing protein n=1 Tax=Acuticoccus kandeliae TaxID=2073160 RepID=UPI000D3EE0EC|nr:DUF3365 domain-containing protein [Acuticoccus kandeliae]
MFRQILTAFSITLVFVVGLALPVAADREDDIVTGKRLATLLRAGRNVVSSHQDLINNPEVGEKNLDSARVIDETLATYEELAGEPAFAAEVDGLERTLMQAELASIAAVIAEHEAEIDMAGVGFKGFIPAVFARLVNEHFAELVGDTALIKVTAPIDLVRNRRARPDDWERNIIETKFLAPDWPTGEAFVEETEYKGRPAFRMLLPEYYSASCLVCHGTPAGEVDVTGYPKEGRSEGDLGGAISITLFK